MMVEPNGFELDLEEPVQGVLAAHIYGHVWSFCVR